jgi:phosphopantothenoylcysteine decarboxylase/phosphopantothenate--cysteine ligase, prokaryotic
LLGVTGSIAAYKSADLVRRLRSAGAEVRVVMTEAATAFVQPLTFQALSGQPVRQDLFDPTAEAAMGHIELARWADVMLVAPASANFMAKLAHGLADDLLSTLCLACDAPIALAPAMNRLMWEHPATQHNRCLLKERGLHLFGPAEGDQACGEVGEGRMLEPTQLVECLACLFATGTLSNKGVLVTAGPTQEYIDPVRFIGNRSSGKMGFAVATAAREAGASVTLISGPVHLATPADVTRIDVCCAEEMFDAVRVHVGRCDIFIAAAAVADYRPFNPAAQKIKKWDDELHLVLNRTPDILAYVASLHDGPFTVGFAAETEHLEAHAKAKLCAKGVHLIAANWVGQPGTGFESEENELYLFWEGGSTVLPRAKKGMLARGLIEHIAIRYHATHSASGAC